MLLFFLSCSHKGAADYARSMLVFDHLLRYWFSIGLPIVDLFKWNHTIFSEESGEVALSVLSHSQPSMNRSQLPNTQDYWLLTRQRYLAAQQNQDLPRIKKHRVAGIFDSFVSFSSFSLSFSSFEGCNKILFIFYMETHGLFGPVSSLQKINKILLHPRFRSICVLCCRS